MPERTFADDGDPVDVAVVVITFRSVDVIDRLLRDLRACVGSTRVSVVVVDNASGDGTDEVVEGHSDVVLVRAGGNGGYAHGVNVGIDASPPADMVMILNPDLRPGSTLLVDLLATLRSNPRVGVVVPLLLDDDGCRAPSLRREPSVLRAFGDAVLGAHWPNRPAWLGEIVYDEDRYRRAGAVDWATGAALGVSTACVESVGRWDDELFFLYSEETDFCRRARTAGWQIEVVPSAVAHHHGGGSGASPVLDAVLALSRVRYMHKHHGPVRAVATWAALVLGHVLRIGRPGGAQRLRLVLRPASYWMVVQDRLGGQLPRNTEEVRQCS